MRHQRPRSDHCPFPDFHSAHDDRTATERGAAANDSFLDPPIAFGLRLPVGIGRPWSAVVNKDNAMPNEDFIFNRDAIADEAVAGDLAASADARAALNLDKRSDTAVIANFASVHIHERTHPHACAQAHIVGDTGMGRHLS